MLMLLVFSVGGYWYLWIYQPTQYTEAVSVLEEDLHENLLFIGAEFPKNIDRAKKTIAFVRNTFDVLGTYI